ncbi:hypothetical protein CHS0354_031057 [Potamilus streckersoni]|uniref:Uncharacterized protein n=1 Tax=Potamilus streckersoni TaxID=2493646 RepID=A0AAE0WB36_9BIVA|nr:hypothetical protein CHS0354_031057 [Potamilus streckersoni]
MKLFRTKQKSRDETSAQQITQGTGAKELEKQSQDERREKNTSENDSQSANDSADEEKREQMLSDRSLIFLYVMFCGRVSFSNLTNVYHQRKKIQESVNAQMAERKKREEEAAKQEAMFYNKFCVRLPIRPELNSIFKPDAAKSTCLLDGTQIEIPMSIFMEQKVLW